MEDILQGSLRRYHIEAVVDDNPLGIVYRAFARRKMGEGIHRRYFAILEKCENASLPDFNAAVQETILTAPFKMHVEEKISEGGRYYVVLAKGEAPRTVNPTWKKLQNKGYLMLFFAAFILILLIIRLSQSPNDDAQPVVSDEHAIESVDL